MNNTLRVRKDQYEWLEEYGGKEIIDALGVQLKDLNTIAVDSGISYKEEAVDETVAAVDASVVDDADTDIVVDEKAETEPEVEETGEDMKELLEFFAKDVVAPLLALVKEQGEALDAQQTKLAELDATISTIRKEITNIGVDSVTAASTPASLMDTFKEFLYSADSNRGGGVLGKASKVEADDPILMQKPAEKGLAALQDAGTFDNFLLGN